MKTVILTSIQMMPNSEVLVLKEGDDQTKEGGMARRKSKPVSFDAMVKFFIRQYNIPTRKDVDKLNARLDRLEKLIRARTTFGGRPLRGSAAGGRGAVERSVVTATEMVLDVIRSHPKGAGFGDIQAATGFESKKIRNIIYRLDKTEKITRKRRGIYVAIG